MISAPAAPTIFEIGIPAMTSVWMRQAVSESVMACMENDKIKEPRPRGPTILLSREKTYEPNTKHPMDVRERAQPYGHGLWFEVPRPTKMVLPVCMETKVLYTVFS